MAIENADFVVYRSSRSCKCKGSDLSSNLKYHDRMVLQRGGDQYHIYYTRGIKKGEYEVSWKNEYNVSKTWWSTVKSAQGGGDGVGVKFPVSTRDASNRGKGDAWARVTEVGGSYGCPTKIEIYHENFRPDQPFLPEYEDLHDDLTAARFNDYNDESQGNLLNSQIAHFILHGAEFVEGFLPLDDGDLLACTDEDGVTKKVTGAQFKELFEPKLPWTGHDGGIFHVLNASEPIYLSNGRKTTVWDPDGSNEREIWTVDPGMEVVFIVPPNRSLLFAGNIDATWEFGPITDTSKVTHFLDMFYDCQKFNYDISDWDTSSARYMDRMFWLSKSFNQDLSKWCVSNINSKPLDFDRDANNWTKPKPVWGTCPRGEDGKKQPPGLDGLTFEALSESISPSSFLSQGERAIGHLHGVPDGYLESEYWEFYDVEQSVSVNAAENIQVYTDMGPYPPRWKCVKKATGSPIPANLSITFTLKTDPSVTKTFSSQVMVLLY